MRHGKGKAFLLCVCAVLALTCAISEAFGQARSGGRSGATRATAQNQTQPRIAVPAKVVPEDGTYFVNDQHRFLIDHVNNQVRMRFVGSDEVFYLSSEPATLGGRLLKYDTGDTALMVAGWGGVTLYTENDPNGLPAERTGDAEKLDRPAVTGSRVKRFAAELSQTLSDRLNLAVGFAADWERLTKEDRARVLAVESMRNAALALEQVLRHRGGRSRASRISVVRVTEAFLPGVTVSRGVLTLSFASEVGPNAAQAIGASRAQAGRPSSRAIAKAIMADH